MATASTSFVPVYRRQAVSLPQPPCPTAAQPRRIRLANPRTDAQWEALIRELIALQPFDDQGIYLQVTRGSPSAITRSEGRCADGVPHEHPLATPSAEQVERGVAVVTAEDNRWRRCDLKTISLVGNVRYAPARRRRRRARDGDVPRRVLTEASASNVLTVIAARSWPAEDNLILPGITYDARWNSRAMPGCRFDVRPVAKARRSPADEMWLSSSTKEVLP